MTPDLLSAFFGWIIILNTGFLIFATVLMTVLQGPASALHGRLFGLPAVDARRAYFGWLAQLKLFTLVFAVSPWLALQLL